MSVDISIKQSLIIVVFWAKRRLQARKGTRKILLIRHVPREKQQLTDWLKLKPKPKLNEQENPQKRMVAKWLEAEHGKWTTDHRIRNTKYGKTGQRQEIKNDSDKPGWLLLSAGSPQRPENCLRFAIYDYGHLAVNVLSFLSPPFGAFHFGFSSGLARFTLPCCLREKSLGGNNNSGKARTAAKCQNCTKQTMGALRKNSNWTSANVSNLFKKIKYLMITNYCAWILLCALLFVIIGGLTN